MEAGLFQKKLKGIEMLIEKTSKTLKVHKALSSIFFLLGLVIYFWSVLSFSEGSQKEVVVLVGKVVTLCSIIWYVVVKFIIWWRHG